MLVDRGILPVIPNGEVLLFAIASGLFAYLFKRRILEGSLFNILKLFVGSTEVPDENDHLKRDRKSRVVIYSGFASEITGYLSTIVSKLFGSQNESRNRHHHHHQQNIISRFLKVFETTMDTILSSLNRSNVCRHQLCTHRYNCISYPIIVNQFLNTFFLVIILFYIVSVKGLY
jgi:hypothetical protein